MTPWSVQLDQVNKQIVISTRANLHLDLVLQGLTKAGKDSTVDMQINVCGGEVITSKINTTFEVIYPLNSGSGSEKLMTGHDWFKSTDPLCPVIKFKIEQSANGETTFAIYTGNKVIQNGGILILETAEPLK